MYILEPSRRVPAPLAGFGAVALPPAVKFLTGLAAVAAVVWGLSKTKPGRKAARRVRRALR